MDSIRYRYVIVLLVSALLIGFGPIKAKATDYFPLEVGNRWTYSPSFGSKGDRVDTIIGKEEVNGTPAYIWNRQEAPDDNYNEKRWLAKDDAYLNVYKLWSNEGMDPSVTFSPPMTILKLNPAVGDTWVFEGDLGSIHAKITYYVESITANITISAGTFNNCMIVRVLDEITDNGATEYSYRKIWYAPDVGPIIYRKYTQNWNSITISQELVSFSLIVSLADYDKMLPVGSWWKYSYIYPSGQNDFTVSIRKITSGPYIGKLRKGDWYEYHPNGTEIRWSIYDIFEEGAILYEESGQTIDPPLVVNIDDLLHELDCFVNCNVYPKFNSSPNYLRKEEKITVLAGTFYDILVEFNIDSEKGYPPNSANYLYGLDPVEVPYAVTHIRWKARNIGIVKCIDINSETGEIMHRYELKSSFVPSPAKAMPWIPLLLLDD